MRKFYELEDDKDQTVVNRLMRGFHRLDVGVTENPDTPILHVNGVVTMRAWQRQQYKEQALTALVALGIPIGRLIDIAASEEKNRNFTELDSDRVRALLAGASRYKAHTDGSASYKAGTGGWGVVWDAVWDQPDSPDPLNTRTVEMIGGDPLSTNNRMEMMAVIVALKMVPRGAQIEIVTDSEYVMKGCNLWLRNWKLNDWIGNSGKAVANVDLWQRLDKLLENRAVTWQWVKGHTGIEGNEKADKLASKGRRSSFPITIHDPAPDAELDFEDAQETAA